MTVSTKRRATLGASAVLSVFIVLVGSSPAHALPFPADVDSTQNSFGITDSSGNSIDQFTMSMDTGSFWDGDHIAKDVMSLLIDIVWALYKVVVASATFLLDWMLKGEWATTLTTPVRGFTTALETAIGQLGLGPLFLTILAAIVAFTLFAGRTGKAVSSLVVGVTIAALAAGGLAHPSSAISGDGGYIDQAFDASSEISAKLFSEDEVSGMSAKITDSLIRAPHQIINYGTLIDGQTCSDGSDATTVYNAALGKDKAYEDLKACNEEYGKAASRFSADVLAWGLSLFPVGFAFAFFSGAVILVLMLTVIGAAFSGARLVWGLIVGVLPGTGRGSLLQALASLGASLMAIAVAQTFVAIWMTLVAGAFSADLGIPLMVRFIFASLLIMSGIVAMFLLRRRLTKAMKKVADRINAWGNGGATTPRQPVKIGGVARSAFSAATRLATLHALHSGGAGPAPTQVGPPAGSAPLPPPTVGPTYTSAGPTPPPTGPTGPAPQIPPTLPSAAPGSRQIEAAPGGMSPKSRELIGRLGSIGFQVGMAAATGGTSAIAGAAAKAVGGQLIASAASKALSSPHARSAPMPRTERNEDLRARLQQAREVTMREGRDGTRIDVSSGDEYRSTRVNGVEILTPNRRPQGPAPAPQRPQEGPVTHRPTTAGREGSERATELRRRLQRAHTAMSTTRPGTSTVASTSALSR